MPEHKITNLSQNTKYGKDLEVTEVYTITFYVGDSGPFTVDVPVEGYTERIGREAVESKAREIEGTLGV